jgi:hypothetical protein
MARFLALALFLATSPALADSAVLWAGIDYSQCEMHGTSVDFKDPDQIFPGYLDTWNALVLKELMKKLADGLRAEVTADTSAMIAVNKKASKDQIKPDTGVDTATPRLSDAELAKQVRSYGVQGSGYALAFVMDRMVKSQQLGCLHAVLFTIGSKKIVKSSYHCEKAEGFGFRNFWFRPAKTVIEKRLGEIAGAVGN